MASIPSMSAVYDQYFRSGLYTRRYPRPNPAMARLIRSVMPAQAKVLDFGCGNGRYLPLFLEQPGFRVTAYDISAEAVATVRSAFATEIADGRLDVVFGGMPELQAAIEPGSQDLILLLFGVLGHIRGRAERIATLRALRALLRPGGRLLLTVPNRRRRFHAEQARCAKLVSQGELEPGDVLYSRQSDSITLDLFYHLFTQADFLAELREAGLTIVSTFAESVLSEHTLITLPGGAAIDAVLQRLCPLDYAYGFGALAERPPGA